VAQPPSAVSCCSVNTGEGPAVSQIKKRPIVMETGYLFPAHSFVMTDESPVRWS
jgi:hypothetical protein